MQANPVIKDEVNKFFQEKFDFQRTLEEVEKKVFELSRDLETLRLKLEKLSKLIQKQENEYFKLKVRSLELNFKKLKAKKSYKQLEFDRLFKILSQIKQTDKVESLDEAIKTKIEKIAKAQVSSQAIVRKKKNYIPDRENKYLIFNFQKTLYMIQSLPKRVLHNVPYSKKNLVYKGKKFLIFPSYVSSVFGGVEKSNVVIFRKGSNFFALRYDFFEDEVELKPDELQKKLLDSPKPLPFLKYFFKWKGMKCFYITPT
ncbi:MAG: hypothetical protein N3A69_10400 [Leptospiraceae bacterium]|nr:hypothetical protein [Leptospiraceae bacterium]